VWTSIVTHVTLVTDDTQGGEKVDKEIRYDNKEFFTRRHLYIHNYNDKMLAVEAAKQGTDKSSVLNLALALYFAKTKGENK